MQKRVHSREFKLEVVRQAASGEKRPAQLCREYGLAESVLSRWRKEYQEKGEAAFQVSPSGEVTTQEQKIAELERFCGQLALENQVLKKTLRARLKRCYAWTLLRFEINVSTSNKTNASVNGHWKRSS